MYIKNMLKLDKSFINCRNPEFIEMARHVTDSYWQNKLLLAAKNKFPKKVSYRNGEIRFRKNSSMATEKLPLDPEIASCMVINFIRMYTGLFSKLDKKANLNRLMMDSNKYVPLQHCTWKDLKGKGTKSAILDKYARELTIVMSLTELQRCQLIKTVQCGLICGRLSNDHMTMTGGSISNIAGLCYDPDECIFKLDPTLAPFKPDNSIKLNMIVALDENYTERRIKQPIIGGITNNVVSYLTYYLASEHTGKVVPAPVFIIMDDVDSDISELDNYIETSNDQSPDTDQMNSKDMISDSAWSDSSFNSLSSVECR